MTLTPLGDSAVVISVGAKVDDAVVARVRELALAIADNPPPGVVEVVPAFASVTVYYDSTQLSDFSAFCRSIEARVAGVETTRPVTTSRCVEIPVCYGGEFGPDLEVLAAAAGLSCDEAVTLHYEASYFVQAIGFLPGFGYLGGLPARLHTPRRATPRTQVPAGAVGIGGALTGVYPMMSPGGWNVIGRTPLRMFDCSRAEPTLLRCGDRVRFTPISEEEFLRWR